MTRSENYFCFCLFRAKKIFPSENLAGSGHPITPQFLHRPPQFNTRTTPFQHLKSLRSRTETPHFNIKNPSVKHRKTPSSRLHWGVCWAEGFLGWKGVALLCWTEGDLVHPGALELCLFRAILFIHRKASQNVHRGYFLDIYHVYEIKWLR